MHYAELNAHVVYDDTSHHYKQIADQYSRWLRASFFADIFFEVTVTDVSPKYCNEICVEFFAVVTFKYITFTVTQYS